MGRLTAARAAAPRRPIRSRTRDPAEKRARVMAAARRLFAERGYAATTTADVASRAGVSEGILFHHFGSKEGLLAAVAGEYGRGLTEAMFAGEPFGAAPPAAERMLERAFAYVREQGTLARLLVLSADPSGAQTARQATRAPIMAALARAFADWSARGLVRPLDPQIAAELLFAMVDAALIACFVRGGGAREEDYLRETVRCVEGAVLPRPDLASPNPRARRNRP